MYIGNPINGLKHVNQRFSIISLLKCIGSDYYNLTEPSSQILMVDEPMINLESVTCGNQEKKEKPSDCVKLKTTCDASK